MHQSEDLLCEVVLFILSIVCVIGFCSSLSASYIDLVKSVCVRVCVHARLHVCMHVCVYKGECQFFVMSVFKWEKEVFLSFSGQNEEGGNDMPDSQDTR